MKRLSDDTTIELDYLGCSSDSTLESSSNKALLVKKSESFDVGFMRQYQPCQESEITDSEERCATVHCSLVDDTGHR